MTFASAQRSSALASATVSDDHAGRMLRTSQRVSVVSTGLLSGGTLAVLVAQGPLGASGPLFTGFMQGTVGPYTALLVPLGAVGAVSTACTLAFGRHNRAVRVFAAAALILLLIGMMVTVTIHLPLNAEILTWSASSPPADWAAVHDRWSIVHVIRTVTTVAAFVLVVLAATRRARR